MTDKYLIYFAKHDENVGFASTDEVENDDSSIVVMEDTETGEEYTFELVDQFDFEGSTYCVLLTIPEGEDDEEDAVEEWIITKIVEESESGEFNLMSLDEDESDRVYEEYNRLLDEYDEESQEE